MSTHCGVRLPHITKVHRKSAFFEVTLEIVIGQWLPGHLINLKLEMCVPVSVCPGAMTDSWMHYMLPVERVCDNGGGYTQRRAGLPEGFA